MRRSREKTLGSPVSHDLHSAQCGTEIKSGGTTVLVSANARRSAKHGERHAAEDR